MMIMSVPPALWFLWFLCWLVIGFAVYAAMLDSLNIKNVPQWFTASPLRYLWLVPLTMLPQTFMGLESPSFGPDTSVGLLPLPQVFFYYAIFGLKGGFQLMQILSLFDPAVVFATNFSISFRLAVAILQGLLEF